MNTVGMIGGVLGFLQPEQSSMLDGAYHAGRGLPLSHHMDPLLIFADDFHLEAGGLHSRPAFMVFFLLCQVVGTTWVGFDLLLGDYAFGLTERRAAGSFVRWARRTSDAGVIHARAFDEALGRVVFVASALELIRLALSYALMFGFLPPGLRQI